MMIPRILITVLLVVSSATLHAEPAGTLVSLTPAQIEAAKESGAKRTAANPEQDFAATPDRSIHGEVGFAIGTGGYRSQFAPALRRR